MDNFDFDFCLIVGEGTKFLVLAFTSLAAVCLAEFTLVPGRVINLFDFIVCKLTIIFLTLFCWTEFMAVIFEVGPSFVHIIVVERTGLPFMMVYLNLVLPFRGHIFVLWVIISKRKNSPYSKCFRSLECK